MGDDGSLVQEFVHSHVSPCGPVARERYDGLANGVQELCLVIEDPGEVDAFVFGVRGEQAEVSFGGGEAPAVGAWAVVRAWRRTSCTSLLRASDSGIWMLRTCAATPT